MWNQSKSKEKVQGSIFMYHQKSCIIRNRARYFFTWKLHKINVDWTLYHIKTYRIGKKNRKRQSTINCSKFISEWNQKLQYYFGSSTCLYLHAHGINLQWSIRQLWQIFPMNAFNYVTQKLTLIFNFLWVICRFSIDIRIKVLHAS